MDNLKTSIPKVMKNTTKKNLKTLAVAVVLLGIGSPQTVEAKAVTVSEAVERIEYQPGNKGKVSCFPGCV